MRHGLPKKVTFFKVKNSEGKYLKVFRRRGEDRYEWVDRGYSDFDTLIRTNRMITKLGIEDYTIEAFDTECIDTFF